MMGPKGDRVRLKRDLYKKTELYVIKLLNYFYFCQGLRGNGGNLGPQGVQGAPVSAKMYYFIISPNFRCK